MMKKPHARKANTFGSPSKTTASYSRIAPALRAMVKTEKARINGIELSYTDRGEGPSVLFVHGSNVDCRVWADHSEIIAPRYRVIAPTQRYFGLSPWPDDGRNFSIQIHASDLATFISALRLNPVTIVGWSYGAAVCLALAVGHPELVKRLFLYEPALATFVSDPLAARRAVDDRLEMVRAAKLAASGGNVESAVQLFMDGVNDHNGAFRSLPDSVQQMMLDNARMLPLLFAAPPPQITCEDLSRLAVHVTVARGGETRTFYSVSAECAAQCIPGATSLTIPSARHLWPIENPRAFSRVVLNFLKEI
jgi:pimeloyl-ACP methyl ester carboxylesterase